MLAASGCILVWVAYYLCANRICESILGDEITNYKVILARDRTMYLAVVFLLSTLALFFLKMCSVLLIRIISAGIVAEATWFNKVKLYKLYKPKLNERRKNADKIVKTFLLLQITILGSLIWSLQDLDHRIVQGDIIMLVFATPITVYLVSLVNKDDHDEDDHDKDHQ